MRFDDSLSTVLSADMSPGFGAAATWRQLVDLLGRRRVAADEPLLARLRMLRQAVATEVRAASARALAFATPDVALVGLFAEDELSVAAPVLRTVQFDAGDWLTLLPRLSPPQRSVLRHRRDLPVEVVRALESFGAVDFVLPEPAVGGGAAAADLASPAAALDDVLELQQEVTSDAPVDETALQQPGPDLDPDETLPTPVPDSAGGYAISDLVARIEAFNRRRATPSDAPGTVQPASAFRYETDATGAVRWVDGVARAGLVGVSLATGAEQGLAQVDGAVAGAFRRRSPFEHARLEVKGLSDAEGSWRLSGVPQFDPDTGRFMGYHGAGRRPRSDESATPRSEARQAGIDSLRQLVHELRTPTNAIAGFAELIESELLGPVSPTYRARAGTIRAHAADLLTAIEDLDTAARIEGHALELRSDTVEPAPLIARILTDLEPLAAVRGAALALDASRVEHAVAADEVAVERLVGRLIAAALSTAAMGERLGVAVTDEGDHVSIAVDRPAGLSATGEEGGTLQTVEASEGIDGVAGMPLLGTGFALRLARNLTRELGGSLSIGANRLTLRLPAALDRGVEQATTF